jgi:hypothetical protein
MDRKRGGVLYLLYKQIVDFRQRSQLRLNSSFDISLKYLQGFVMSNDRLQS